MMHFFDSYAIFEIININPNYVKFQNEIIITSILNLGEVYYGLLKREGKEKTEIVFSQLKSDLAEINLEIIKHAMEFRHKNMKRKLSTIDCIGYTIAKKLDLPFLTGDNGFEGLPNVEFVK